MIRHLQEISFDNTNGYCVINIRIPDKELVKELVEEFHNQVNKTIASNKTREEQRVFLNKVLKIATSKNQLEEILHEARNNGDTHCVVIAFNATLPTRVYEELNVINFTYLSWTQKAWNKAKEILNKPLVKKLLDCLLSQLLSLSCHAIRAYMGWT